MVKTYSGPSSIFSWVSTTWQQCSQAELVRRRLDADAVVPVIEVVKVVADVVDVVVALVVRQLGHTHHMHSNCNWLDI